MIDKSVNHGTFRSTINNLETNLNTINNDLNTLNTEITETINTNINNINTDINNINTDINNIKSQYLPLAGGVMTGSIKASSKGDLVYGSSDDTILQLCSGTSYLKGAYIYLTGQNSSEAGLFSIGASNNGTICRLKGNTDGTLTWNGDPVTTYGANNRKTLLFSYSGGYGTGTITLSQAYTNFNAIGVLIGSDTSNRCLTYVLTPVWVITYAKSLGATGFDISGGRHYWEINLSTSTTTSLTSYSENSRIYAIWGLT